MIARLSLRLGAVLASVAVFIGCGSKGRGGSPASSSAEALVNGQPVVWTGLVNATVSGDTLTKTGGQPQMEDSGAVSQQQIARGDASLQFTMSETSTFKFVGFGHSPTWPKAAGIDFSFRMQSGHVDAYENNQYVESSYGQPGDVFTITVHGSTIDYLKNGVSFHTTTKTPTYPLIVAASLIDSGATITGAQVESSSDPDGGAPASGKSFSGWLTGSPAWAENNSAAGDPYYEWFLENTDSFDSVNPTWWSYKGDGGACCTLGSAFAPRTATPRPPTVRA